MVIVDILLKEKYGEVQDFYNTVGYLKKIEEGDRVIGAISQNRIIGAARISIEEDIFVLRGMQIALIFQRQGVGTRILNEVNFLIERDVCWCISYQWLEDFYNRIGFKKVPESQAPLFLQERIAETRKTHPQIIMMVKNSK
ncbi:MAG: GNAT family N-acetyltransferase [Chlamydiota bacterium]